MPVRRKSRTAGCAASGASSGVQRAARARLAVDHGVVAEDVEHRQRRPAGQRVAGVGVRVQEPAGGVVVVERREHLVAGEHARQRQHAAGEALGQAQEVRCVRVRLLPREQRAGAAEARHDLVGDQVDAMPRGDRARLREVGRVVHRHAGRALDQRFDDQRGRRRMVAGEVGVERGRGGFHADAKARIGTRHDGVGAQQRRIGVAEERHIGHRERAQRLPVIAAGEAHEAALVGLAAIAPVVEAHLQRDLGGGGAVGAVERVAQSGRRERGQPFREFHHRAVREAGEQHVVEFVQLRAQRGHDARLAVAEEIHPPRAHRVEVAAAVEVVQPHTFAAGDRHERQRLVHLHLRARMPYGGAAAREPGGIAGRWRWRCRFV